MGRKRSLPRPRGVTPAAPASPRRVKEERSVRHPSPAARAMAIEDLARDLLDEELDERARRLRVHQMKRLGGENDRRGPPVGAEHLGHVRRIGPQVVVAAHHREDGLLVRDVDERLELHRARPAVRLRRERVAQIVGRALSRIGEQLAKNPWIETVKVRRYFPHTLTIDIAEREPAAMVKGRVLTLSRCAGGFECRLEKPAARRCVRKN